MRKKLGGKQSLWQNMALFGVDGNLGIFVDRIGWGFGSTLARGGDRFVATSDLILELGLKSNFGRMCGVGICPSKMLFLAFLILPESRMCLLLITLNDQMILFNGMLLSLARYTIGKWRLWHLSTHSCIHVRHAGKGRTGCGGFFHVKENSRLDLSIGFLLQERPILFLEKVFGAQSSLRELRSLPGRLPLVRSLPWITFRREV